MANDPCSMGPGSRMRGRFRNACRTSDRLAKLVLLLAIGATQLAFAAGPLPAGGRFVAGSGTIAVQGNTLNVTQDTQRAVIDWTSFSIGNGNTVNVNNGGIYNSTLARVTGNERSVIDGTLSATSHFYLVNPQGVLIGKNGVVTTGGHFVAATLDTDNDHFMNGDTPLFAGTGSGTVVNMGKISSSGGNVYLVSRTLAENDGSIGAPKGSVELAVGDSVQIKGPLIYDPAATPQTFVSATGSHGDAVNKGTIEAARIALQAADGNVFALAGNNTALRATGTATRDGHIWLVAPKGTAHVHSRIDATEVSGSGGTVDTTANALHLDDADIRAAQWNLNTPRLDIGPLTAAILATQLSQGTSVALNATQGDVNLLSTLRWNGGASLAVNAFHSVTIGSTTTLGNAGAGNLTLRADASGIDNGAGVTNRGTIDWSRSSGFVAALYDMNGAFVPGTIRTNAAWSAAPYSGLKTQLTAYRLVNSIADLTHVADNLNGIYALGKDVTGAAGDPAFNGIGVGADAEFNGQFDGLGHVLRGVGSRLSDPSAFEYAGLFAVIGTAGVVRNLGVSGGADPASNGTGGIIAGRNRGLITNSYSSGSVGSPETIAIYGGGLVGQNDGIIERSWRSEEVGGSGEFGGLVGVNNGTIRQSLATGSVGGGSHSSSGGLVGLNNGTVRQSYAAGNVGGEISGAAGLVEGNGGTVDESFSISIVTNGLGPGPRGGLFDSNNPGSTNVYWDVEASGQSDGGPYVPVANGLTTAQMSTSESFAPSWNFGLGGTWVIPAGATHPVLQWQVQGQ